MQSKCLVTYGDRNVAVAFDEPWTGRDLIEHLKGLDMFSEVDASAIGLTRFDEDFDVFVDITEVDVIENKSRIKVRLTSQVRIADVLEESAQPSQPARTGAYCLPDVPPDIAWMAAVLADAEDAETIAGHVLAMTKEVAKARPDMAYIEDCMSRTLPSRREWVSQDSPSVDDIIKKYPALLIGSIDPTKTHYVPTVTFMGNVLTSDAFAVRLEDIEIAEKSLLAAISTQMALYWATNIVFDKKAQRTFDVLSRALKVKSGLRPTPLVSVTLTTLSH
ncbi:hypothetical protein MRX96_050342 [Rhipicephalus microplus]